MFCEIVGIRKIESKKMGKTFFRYACVDADNADAFVVWEEEKERHDPLELGEEYKYKCVKGSYFFAC